MSTACRMPLRCPIRVLRCRWCCGWIRAQDHTQVVQALVLSLKANGFIAYVPAFDAKGPVYLCDKDGNVQVRYQFTCDRKTRGARARDPFTRSARGRNTRHDREVEARRCHSVGTRRRASGIFALQKMCLAKGDERVACFDHEPRAGLIRPPSQDTSEASHGLHLRRPKIRDHVQGREKV